jgi:hypothetical protein
MIGIIDMLITLTTQFSSGMKSTLAEKFTPLFIIKNLTSLKNLSSKMNQVKEKEL